MEGCLTPWDVQSKRVFTADAVSPTLQAGCGNAKQIAPIVLIGGGFSGIYLDAST